MNATCVPKIIVYCDWLEAILPNKNSSPFVPSFRNAVILAPIKLKTSIPIGKFNIMKMPIKLNILYSNISFFTF